MRLPHRRRPTRELVPLAAIAADALCLRDGGLRAILECPTLAFGIKGEAEQRAIVDGWAALLNSLGHPLEICIRTRALDTRALPALSDTSDERRAPFAASYARLVAELASEQQKRWRELRELLAEKNVVLVDGPEQALAVANAIAPEHLELMCADAEARHLPHS